MTEDEQIRQRILDNEFQLSVQNLKYNSGMTWTREAEEIWKAKVHIMTEMTKAIFKETARDWIDIDEPATIAKIAHDFLEDIFKQIGETPAAIQIETDESTN